ncbi:MAG: YjaG family protein [Pirellulaceae bacterium]|nr:YjaG family protein [Pirellulaceae bacterium]
MIPRVRRLSHQHQLLFACCCCQRMVPNYRDFAEDEGWDDAGLLERTMDRLWTVVGGSKMDSVELTELIATIDSLPLNDATCKSWFLGMAQDSATALYQCLQFHATNERQSLDHVAGLALGVIKEWFSLVSDFNPAGYCESDVDFRLGKRLGLKPPNRATASATDDEAEEEYRHSRLVQAECDKQRFDVDVLEMHPELTEELIALMRQSSSMQGVQVRLRGLRVDTPR